MGSFSSSSSSLVGLDGEGLIVWVERMRISGSPILLLLLLVRFRYILLDWVDAILSVSSRKSFNVMVYTRGKTHSKTNY